MVTADARVSGRVLLAADLVPAGRVVSYGDLAELVGTSARRVGRVMALHGHETHWWRVVNHSGDLPGHLLAEAGDHWRAEGITEKSNGRGCRIRDHRADLAELAGEWERRRSGNGGGVGTAAEWERRLGAGGLSG